MASSVRKATCGVKTQFGAESSLYAACAFELADGQVREVADMETLRVREPLVDAGGAASAHTQDASAPCALAFDDAWFRYDRESPWVLRNLDLSVAKGRIHALVGGNDCG